MPARGLSLIGFCDQHEALSFLRTFAVSRDASEGALLAEWAAAKAKIGASTPRAGLPDVRSVDSPCDAYIRKLWEQRWVRATLDQPEYQNAEFKLIEIEPLLAHQPFVNTERPDQIYGSAPALSLTDLMPICLPLTQPQPLGSPTQVVKDSHSIVIKGRDLEMNRITAATLSVRREEIEQNFIGVQISWNLPFVHVVRFNGRHYLYNGYHRALGAAARGATHIPCLLREWLTSEQGEPSWLMMPRRVLESSNPPTLGHFLRGCAYPVLLRAMSRIVSVSWSERLMPDEYEGL